MPKNKITSKTTLEKIMKLKNGEEILQKFGVPCIHCPMAGIEMSYLKLGDVCKAYGVDLKRLLKELNK